MKWVGSYTAQRIYGTERESTGLEPEGPYEKSEWLTHKSNRHCFNKIRRILVVRMEFSVCTGSIATTESLVNCLRKMFKRDIRAFVPQIAMSAGTMIA